MTNDDVNTVVDAFDMKLTNLVYAELDEAVVSFEVRDFGTPHRQLVVRSYLDGIESTLLIPWEDFITEFDTMRARMMSEDWDTSLMQLVGGPHGS